MSASSSRAPAALRDGDLVAALDLGSNSFHIVVAQRVLGQLRVVDRLRETVRMAEGLNALGGLSPEVRERALACLSRFGQRIAHIPRRQVRATEEPLLRASSVVSPQAPSLAALPRPPLRRPITAPARPMSPVRPATGAVSASGMATAGASVAFRSATKQALTV